MTNGALNNRQPPGGPRSGLPRQSDRGRPDASAQLRQEAGAELFLSVKAYIAQWEPTLRAVIVDWQATLPAEAANWPLGAAYIRESSAESLAGGSPDTQLRNVLEMMARRQYYVTVETLFFEVQSATQTATRGAFQRLYELALAGGVKAIGVFLSERLFRNVEDSIRVKRDFRKKGIELVFLGKFEGDQRNPAVWQAETMQEVVNELHARNTGFQVGLAFERRSRAGLPIGKMPEVYEPDGRAPSILGRRGSVDAWKLSEPLASILKEGCARYLAGASFADLARWSQGTELAGLTPRGRVMHRRWWYMQLRNPRYAGFQMPTNYQGYKPGIEFEKRARVGPKSELVPTVTPALWGWDEFREVLRLALERSTGSKVRYRYRAYLLSGIAVDARCGHRMKVNRAPSDNGHYSMRCNWQEPTGPHSGSVRADVAELELDALLAGLSFDDAGLQRQIAEELRALGRTERAERDAFRANPEIGAARQALVALGDSEGFAEDRLRLAAKIDALQRADAERRDLLDEPVIGFRRALELLGKWGEVWQGSDTRLKNKLLREAGVRVRIAQDEPAKQGRPARITEISVENPAFALALGVALAHQSATLGRLQSRNAPNVAIALRIDPQFAPRAAHLGRFEGGIVLLERPDVPVIAIRTWRIPEPDGGPWLTTCEFGELAGLTAGAVIHRIHSGSIRAVKVQGASRRFWYLIRDPRGARPEEADGNPAAVDGNPGGAGELAKAA